MPNLLFFNLLRKTWNGVRNYFAKLRRKMMALVNHLIILIKNRDPL